MKTMITTFAVFLSVTAFGNFESKQPASLKTAEVKAPVRMSNLPKEARQFIKENYPAKAVTYVSKMKDKKGGTVYEVGLKVDDELYIIQFDAQGELISETTAAK
ncbi:hypothetical protein [Flavobacterium sp. BFFFF1]|uniref:hypothetical protein n=1 Tax=Flavobacterium sp. BFFFF1 TaxID=2015557 RepID=UPI0025BADF59|nr:hypothetical protein [Flavobacterium sp. BFFFF1]